MSTQIPDVRRWLAFKAHGAMRYLVYAQGYMADVRGAVEMNEPEAAAYLARVTVLKCLSIAGLATEGEVLEPDEYDQVTFDACAGVEPALVQRWLLHSSRPLEPGWSANKMEWLAELEGLLQDTERALGFAQPLAELRSPRGISTMLRIARIWDRKSVEAGLPSALPREWAGGSKPSDAKAAGQPGNQKAIG